MNLFVKDCTGCLTTKSTMTTGTTTSSKFPTTTEASTTTTLVAHSRETPLSTTSIFFLIDTCIYVCGYKSTPGTCILIMALGQVRIFIICWDMRPGFCGCILTIANIIISDIFMTIKEYYWHLNYTRSPQTYLKTWHHNNKVVPILRIYLV